ncbi:hypothetical protein H9L39_12428, partial [Fusarium oxysporum f. sp. albedinis]
MKLDRSRAASESLPDYNNAVEFPDDNSGVPGSSIFSIEALQDAPTTSSLDLSTSNSAMTPIRTCNKHNLHTRMQVLLWPSSRASMKNLLKHRAMPASHTSKASVMN